MTQIATRNGNKIARPLKVLVPLIKNELEAGDDAGVEHYRQAGEYLLEAKDSGQIPLGSFGAWVNRNFHRSLRTAQEYMQLARKYRDAETRAGGAPRNAPESLRQSRGSTDRDRAYRVIERQLFKTVNDVDVDLLAQNRQSQRDEIKMHRELALELIDIGYKALATRLHPDRGGSKDAMRRLNTVRAELNSVAETRRFE